MATKRKSGRFRIGYSGCGTDLIVFAVLGAGALWGIHHWNGMEKHPFHLGRIPLPRLMAQLPAPIRHWFRPDPAIGNEPTTSEAQPTPSPSATPVPSTESVASPTSAPAATPLPPSMPSATPYASSSPMSSPSPDSGRSQLLATVVKLVPKVSDSPTAIQASATQLAQRNGALYLGLPDGGVAIWNGPATGKGHGTVVRLPSAAGAVRAIAAGPDGTVWWLTGIDGHLYSYRPKGKLLRSLDLTMLGTAAAGAEDIAVLPGESEYGNVAVLGKGSTTIIDGETGALRNLGDVLPAGAASSLERPESSALFSYDAVKKETSLLVLSGAVGGPTTLSLWTTKSGNHPDTWDPQPMDDTTAPPFATLRYAESGRSCVALGAGGLALLAKPAGGQTLAACNLWTTQFAQAGPLNLQPYKTLPDGVFGLWAAPDRIALGRSGLWWIFGGTIFHAALPAGRPEAYLPWNGAGDEKHGKIASVLADDTGLWVATDTGVHRIVPAHPSADLGYGGYLRAPLGPDAAQAPANPTDQKLAQISQEWQGTPYKWGGDTKAGIDCSGYVCKLFGGVGITVPRATGELANGSEGKRVRDELKYGDVLVFPGHCGMYIGNGWTTEALDAGVGKAAIWSRKNVVVKRFLK